MRDAVFRTESGLWLARHNGQISEVKSASQAKANAHLQKLQAGLVRMVPMGSSKDHDRCRAETLGQVLKF